MWREVVAMKRLFKEMQTSSKIDLNKIRTDISAANREIAGACNAVNVNLRHVNRVEVKLNQISHFYFVNSNFIQTPLVGSSADAH
jgi:hypothetical protein